MKYNTTRKEYWECWMGYHEYHRRTVETIATLIDSDGCSGVPDFYLLACKEHDIAYRLGVGCHGEPITRAEADKRFRWHIQMKSPLGRLSPVSWWRYAGVRMFGGKSWLKDREETADRIKRNLTPPGSVEP